MLIFPSKIRGNLEVIRNIFLSHVIKNTRHKVESILSCQQKLLDTIQFTKMRNICVGILNLDGTGSLQSKFFT